MTMAALKIMVVDDDSNICELLRLYLEKEGYEAVIEENGALALEHFDREQPDLILLDVMMPQLDGYEATRAIRALDRPDAGTIPIFAMTANAFTEDRRRAYDSGMNEHLTKPLEPDTLLRTLAKYLQR